ncbi:MAG: hypothetical protein ACFFBD_11190 [Candidatus Hodarchaeota archaeon]
MKKPIASARLSSQNQVSLTKEVRDVINAKAGDLILFFKNEKGEIVIKAEVKV